MMCYKVFLDLLRLLLNLADIGVAFINQALLVLCIFSQNTENFLVASQLECTIIVVVVVFDLVYLISDFLNKEVCNPKKRFANKCIFIVGVVD